MESKNVLFILNDDGYAEALAIGIRRAGYDPLRVGSITEAREKIQKGEVYAAIFARSVPLEPFAPVTNDAGIDYLGKLIRETTIDRLGMYMWTCAKEVTTCLDGKCLEINGGNRTILRESLDRLLH